jgi:fibronectin type 3 domain-containing protein
MPLEKWARGLRRNAQLEKDSASRISTRRRILGRAVAAAWIERLESRQLLSGTSGLNDAVYHLGGGDSTDFDSLFGGDLPALARVANYAATNRADYTFLNPFETFNYQGGSQTLTGSFLGADATGLASSDGLNMFDTIVDAKGFFQAPVAGVYNFQIGNGFGGQADDIVGIYVNGNGASGSGTLVAADGSGGAASPFETSPTTPGHASYMLPAGNVPVEVIYGSASGSSLLNGIQIIDPTGTGVAYTTEAQNVVPASPVLNVAGVGDKKVGLAWNTVNFASSYSLYRSDPTNPAAMLVTSGITDTSYTDSTVSNNVAYSYYITADNASGSSAPSNTVMATPGATGAPTDVVLGRTDANTVQVTFTPPLFGGNYTISRSSSAAGPFTAVTPAGGITAASFADGSAPVAGNTDYYYIVTSNNSAGSTPSAVAFIGHGDGWQASYYASDTSGANVFSGDQSPNAPLTQPDATPVPAADPQPPMAPPTNGAVLGFQRIDPMIDSPATPDSVPPAGAPASFNTIQGAGNQGADFAARWVGYVQPQASGYYTFFPSGQDGMAVTVYDTTHLTGGQPTPVTLQPENLYGYGQLTTATVPVVDSSGTPVQWIAGDKYLVQVDFNHGFGGWEAHLSWAAASTSAGQAADLFDAAPLELVPTSQVNAPVEQFKSSDAANPNGLAKDNSYYGLAATSGGGVVQLVFSNVGADSYNIYRSTTGAAGSFTQINTSPVKATTGGAVSYVDSAGLATGTTYYYIVTGVDASGETPMPAGLTASVVAAGGPLAAPGAVSANRIGESNSVGISFSPSPFATSYDVKRGTALNADGSLGGTIVDVTPGGISSTTATDASSSPDTTYYYAVTAGNATQSSASSSAATVGAIAASAGLYDSVYHLGGGNSNSSDNLFGGDLAALGRVISFASANAPNYAFINAADLFNYQGGASTLTPAFLGADAPISGPASTDPSNVNDTIFDAQGYIVAPTAGTYTFTIGNGMGAQADDIVGVYVGGNGTPGSGTLVAADGYQGAASPFETSATTPGIATFMLPAGDSRVEIVYGNAAGNANLNGVTITGPDGKQVSYVTAIASQAVHLAGTTIGDGTAQRSEVRGITLKFDQAITLGAGAVTLGAYSGNDTTGTLADGSAALGTPTTTDGGLTWTIPILNSTAFSDATGSLKDGIYKLTVDPSKITGGTLSGTNLSTTFHRLYGDIDGNKTVNSADYFKFKAAFGSIAGQANFNSNFDFDANGKINSSDYFKFKANFGRKFVY